MMERQALSPKTERPEPPLPVGGPRPSGVAGKRSEGAYLPADCREITARAVRLVWERMHCGHPPIGDVIPHRLPPDLISFAAAKGSLGPLVAALEYWGLADAITKKEMERAQLALIKTSMAAAAMRSDLALILDECAQRDIEVVLFKGHDLITAYYHDNSIRPITDADLLVRRPDYRRLSGVLTDAGYRQSGDGDSGAWSRGGLIIDVHLRFVGDMRNPASAYLPRIETEEIFDGSVRREIDGVPYRSPDPRHSLIITALHALTHSYLMDYWFMDAGVLLIANGHPSFADDAFDIAERHRLSPTLSYHLWAIREIFGFPGRLPLPTGYRPPRTVERLIRAAVKRTDYLFFGDILLGFTIDSYRKKFYYFKEMALPHRNIIAHEMGIDPRNIPGVYRARLLHLVKSGFRVFFSGRR